MILVEVVFDIACLVFCDGFLVGLKPVLDLAFNVPGQCPGYFFRESDECRCVG